MALTITEKFRWTAGGRAFRLYDIGHDESTSTLFAASIEPHFTEAIMGDTNYSSMPVNMTNLSIAADGLSIDIDIPPKSGSTTHLMAIGW
jgi:hypothetical protein